MTYLSLCLPTNGVSKWVFPVLESVYCQNVNESLFEVVVTNNGNNTEFHKRMLEYEKNHSNLKYKKTDAYMFHNQIEALRIADGEFLKFLNHRSVLENGSLIWMIGVIKEYLGNKPVIYLSNGALGFSKRRICDNFDQFVDGLRHYASWTTGVGVWKSDFEKIPKDLVFNRISPHSDVLFAERHREKYVIDDKLWCHEIDSSHKNKGKYDLYKAFAIEEISITMGLYLDGDISVKTLKHVIASYKQFVALCYLQFNILRKPCSYDISGFNDAMGVFMGKIEVFVLACCSGVKAIPRYVAKRLKFH